MSSHHLLVLGELVLKDKYTIKHPLHIPETLQDQHWDDKLIPAGSEAYFWQPNRTTGLLLWREPHLDTFKSFQQPIQNFKASGAALGATTTAPTVLRDDQSLDEYVQIHADNPVLQAFIDHSPIRLPSFERQFENIARRHAHELSKRKHGRRPNIGMMILLGVVITLVMYVFIHVIGHHGGGRH